MNIFPDRNNDSCLYIGMGVGIILIIVILIIGAVIL